MQVQLILVRQAADWEAYHSIRCRVLYELRGRHDYERDHPDEIREGNFPLLFCSSSEPVGTARLDIPGGRDGIGIVRLVAVLPERQRQGFGRAMMAETEGFAAANDIRRLEVHAADDAVAFYLKLGWEIIDRSRPRHLMRPVLRQVGRSIG